MTTQPDHESPAPARPATLHELRTALSHYGLPGDREQFEQALAAALDSSPIGDFAAVAEVAATYRHRLTAHQHRGHGLPRHADQRSALDPGRRRLRPTTRRRRRPVTDQPEQPAPLHVFLSDAAGVSTNRGKAQTLETPATAPGPRRAPRPHTASNTAPA
ncbi:hypothetical protein ACFWIQ_33930 [Kitasatospora sp. NPDC127059]|uniref:hypothetical protein n=1 Tax=unclassified Kitasatospora TaxID=2633591 RepID=UPI0036684B15